MAFCHHLLLLLTTLVVTVRADGWDDFSNNLATDLSPLIALFGEQATKQFLSESTTLLDNFIFALAPLGILTAVVSAIRVCGGASLRAFIGRAQEGGGIAEAELCSSTSRDVCELYHNGAIVRVFGRPKILEIVHDCQADIDDTSETVPKCGIYSFQDYVRSGFHRKAGWEEQNSKDRPGPDIESQQTSLQSSDSDHGQFAPNPNLSFNIGIREQPPFVLWVAVGVGFILQAGVLVFGAVITYALQWTKDDALPPNWAFPLMLFGTLSLGGGMFFCAFIIENSTRERVFRRASGYGDKGPIIYVVQPGNQIIGDQTFDAFSFTDASHPLTKYTTSWKLQKKSEVKVGLAAGITLAGFILQFVGLRAMHSSVSVFQLGAILFMRIIRAGLRTQRLAKEQNLLRDRPDEVEGHELDWLALQMTQEKPNKQSECPKFWAVTGGAVKLKQPLGSHECSISAGLEKEGSLESNKQSARRTFYYRSRLADLTSQASHGKFKTSTAWDDRLIKARSQAEQLKKAIEGSASILFAQGQVKPGWKAIECFSWIIQVAEYNHKGLGGNASVSIPLHRGNDIGTSKTTIWQVNQHYLEALIGLMVWSIVSHPDTEKDDEFQLKVSGASEIPAFRIMAGGATESEIERANIELKLWIEDSPFTSINSWKEKADPIISHPGTLWGKSSSPTVCHPSPNKPGQEAFRLYGWQNFPDESQPERFTLKSSTNNSISASCAHDIYGFFLCAFLEIFESTGGETKLVGGNQGFLFTNEVVARLVECFKESGLGSTQDGSSILIPVLRYRAKLPSSKEAMRLVPIQAENSRREKNFQEAEDVLKWAWETALVIQDNEALALIMLEIGELYRDLLLQDNSSADLARKGFSWMQDATTNHRSLRGTAIAMIATRYAKIEEMSRNSLHPEPIAQDIIDAIGQDDRVRALWLMGYAKEVRTADGDNRTILSWAAQRGWIEIVKIALHIGSSLNHLDISRRTALSYAAEHGHADIVKILMRRGALPMIEDSLRRTPLSYATGGCHLPAMEILLGDRSVSLATRDESEQSPLHWAAKYGHHKAIAILLQHGAREILNELDKYGHSALTLAISNHHTTAAECLITNGAYVGVSPNKTDSLKWALEHGKWELAAFLLNRFNQRDKTTKRVVITIALEAQYRSPSNGDVNLASNSVPLEIILRELSRDGTQTAITMKTIERFLSGQYCMKVEICEQGHQVSISEPIELELPVIRISGVEWADPTRPAGFIPADRGEYLGLPIQARILDLLMKSLGNDAKVTEEAWIAAARCSPALTAVLLDGMADNSERPNTENVFRAAVQGNSLAEGNIDLLLDRGYSLPITEDIISTVLKELFGVEKLKLLLDRGYRFPVTEDIILEAMGCYNSRVTLDTLLSGRREDTELTLKIVKRAAEHFHGKEIMMMLLDGRAKIKVTKEMTDTVAELFS